MTSMQEKGFLDFVYEFYKDMGSHEISLAYEGEINHQIMKDFTNQIIGKLSKQKEKVSIQKMVYHVMIECLQNISRHAFHTDRKHNIELNHGILVVSNISKAYQITTGNVIKNTKINNLNCFLEKVNCLKKKDLDILYKKQLLEGTLSKKGGAGLGFIDIKRKTGQNLIFHFLPIDHTHSFFLFTSTITKNNI